MAAPKQADVAWDENGLKGKITGTSIICYTRAYAIQCAAQEVVRNLVQTPSMMGKEAVIVAGAAEGNDAVSQSRDQLFPRENPLRRAQPPFSFAEITALRKKIAEMVIPAVVQLMKTVCETVDPAKMHNFQFLAMLGSKGRNWKSQCAVCLVEKMMGTTCGCGHTEIVVFRPCGHSICVAPCFHHWCKTKGLKLNPARMTFGDQTFEVAGKSDLNLTEQQCADAGMVCPCCNSRLTSCFRAEDEYPAAFFKDEAAKIAEQLLASSA